MGDARDGEGGQAADCGRVRDGGPVRGDDGQAVPLLVAVLVCAAVLVSAFGVLGARVSDAARARTAADAAALAGVVDGPDGARRLAAANGAVVEAYGVVGTDVVVRVRVRGAHATARATLSPDPPP